jgi:hypothetical protein
MTMVAKNELDEPLMPMILEDLAKTFPSLRAQLGDTPTMDRLRDIALRRTNAGSGAAFAAQFILSLWDLSAFDVGRAWGVWDGQHRDAWKAWARDPWWP